LHVIYRQTCRICGSTFLTPVIDLGLQYLQGSFLKLGCTVPPIRKLPTKLVRCDVTNNENACGLLQLAHTFPPEILYANYWYRSGTNFTMRNHLKNIVESVLTLLPKGRRRVLDIGCNDGTLLNYYPDSFERVGIDPSDIAQEIKPPIIVYNTMFPSEIIFRNFSKQKFDIITSIAMFYDLEDPIGFAKGIKKVLAEDGIWILEMSYLPLMLEQNSFDTICHEHLEYYSLAVIEFIMRQTNLRVFKAELNDINGGSIRCYVTHADNYRFDSGENVAFLHKLRIKEFELELDNENPYLDFQKRIDKIKSDLRALLSDINSSGKKVHIYGASTKGNVLLQWCQIDNSLIPYASDRNPAKEGAKTIGTNIEIISEAASREMKPDYYLVLPWHFKKEFLERERETILAGTKMIFPLPTISIVDASNLDLEYNTCKSPAVHFLGEGEQSC
jgi:SAM-dependent methyltransferase